MADPQPGPSGLCRPRRALPSRNIFTAFLNDESDEEDDFTHIPHISDHESSSSSDSEDDGSNDSQLRSTDRPTTGTESAWSHQAPVTESDQYPLSFTVRNNKKPRNIPANTERPIDFFQLFITEDLIRAITEETNAYAEKFLSSDEVKQWIADHKSSRYRKWPADGISSSAIKKYIGLVLNMGLTHKPSERHYWTIRPSQASPYFGKVMPMWFYSLISRMIHVNDSEIARGQPGYDPWAKIRPLLDGFNAAAKKYYLPSQHISIDESLIGMKNRCVFIQYMPNKRHARFGIKKFQLCDDNGYVYCVELYAGKDLDVERDDGLAVGIVKSLVESSMLLGKGYHLYTDNFYTKPALADYLWSHRTMITGTIRANSRGFPKDLSSRKLAIGESVYQRKDHMLALAFREKKSQRKPVLLLSTAHVSSSETKEIRGKTVTKPSMVLDYNKHMGGVDISDKKIYHFAAQRSTRRYWKKIFFNLLDMCVLNSWILFNASMPDAKHQLDRRDYIISLVEALCESCDSNPAPQTPPPGTPSRAATPTSRPSTPTAPHRNIVVAGTNHRLYLLEGKKEMDCYVCSDRKTPGGRRRSRHWCPLCEVGCHEKCEPNFEHVTGLGRRRKRRHLATDQ